MFMSEPDVDCIVLHTRTLMPSFPYAAASAAVSLLWKKAIKPRAVWQTHFFA
jgi:hypothetical protein